MLENPELQQLYNMLLLYSLPTGLGGSMTDLKLYNNKTLLMVFLCPPRREQELLIYTKGKHRGAWGCAAMMTSIAPPDHLHHPFPPLPLLRGTDKDGLCQWAPLSVASAEDRRAKGWRCQSATVLVPLLRSLRQLTVVSH